MMCRFFRTACVVGVLGLVACQAPARQPDVAAVLVDPTPQSRAQLAMAVNEMLGVSSVALADDALTRSSVLLIERSPARDPGGVRITGRDYGKPETFTLVKSGGGCVLVSGRDGRRIVLTDATCRVASP
jgi:hypothetical protein